MVKNSIIIGISIIIGCAIIGICLTLKFPISTNSTSIETNDYKFEIIRASDNNIIIFNKDTGEYWRKYIPNGEGPTDWQKEESPAIR